MSRLFSLCTLITLSLCIVLPAQADRLQQQRTLYDQTMSRLSKGQSLDPNGHAASGLQDYPLYPYLVMKDLENRLNNATTQEVEAFLISHGDLPQAQRLKNRSLQLLASRGDFARLRAHYDSDSQNTELDCKLALDLWSSDRSKAMEQAATLWTVGRSQPNACDPLFQRWRDAGGLTETIAWERMRLALLYRQDALASYLIRYQPERKALAELFVATATQPSRLENLSDYQPNTQRPADALAEIVAVALRRMGNEAPEAALALWPHYRDLPFSDQNRIDITRSIGVRLAQRFNPAALPFMAENDPDMTDERISEWRVRLALRSGQWQTAHDLTRNMPNDLSQQSRWQYWLLRSAQLAQPQIGELQEEYGELAQERDFYGFLAAERTQQPYALNHQPVAVDRVAFARVSNSAGVKRAKEFYARGQITDARREWYHVARNFSREELIAQASMARDMDWYFPAIRSISQAQHWDDLDIRFPLAYQQEIQHHARERALSSTWVYAITRQESGFMSDARSPAGALGLMQLMPATARETARRYNISLNNTHQVLDPDRNIALGTAYMAQLQQQFKGNRVLSSAAYNAGPGRVRQWTRNASNMPADLWVETIPFDETRSYVQRVLSYGVIYGDKLGIQQPVMEQHERYLPAFD
ncbi:transglycosylase SLT domain-containing protein [Halopseudomonas salegens]|uniref:Soluble lytic murein transglycosylase n=1 Tax=Halopseudomonas salegens TaxID=1434072 RepID=A0A1H2EZ41_9GAMM|nr:transglycosylase SLT domain-containing protein [Halopseudomonas salegens]SDU00309.1 soluble lytic murein transglycosylase [Halopseudomonas salegens]